jgi:L-2-hydroxyglutarate oxidase LhgO
MDISGQQIKFGPDVEWIDHHISNPDRIGMEPDPSRVDLFYDSIRTYWPQLPDDSLVPDYTGIRPKLIHPALLSANSHNNDYGRSTSSNSTATFQDFVIAGPKTCHGVPGHGIPGLIHLFGIESPGLTSSMAIANHVVEMLES